MNYHCDSCGHDFTAEDLRCPNCLKQSSVRVASEPPMPPGLKRVRLNAWLMVAMAGLSALSVISVMLNLLLEATGHGVSGHGNEAEAAGALGTFVCIGVWALVGLVWAPVNAWGLFQQKAWARRSTLVYWGCALFTCGCIPFAAYGLWSLTRPELVEVTRGWGSDAAGTEDLPVN